MATKPLSRPRRRAKLPAAAEQCGVSVKTLRRRIATGELNAYRLGSRIIVVDLDELDELFSRIPTASAE